MPKAAMLFFIVLLALFSHQSSAFETSSSEINSDKIKNFNSDIIEIDPTFFESNDYKRYLIFGQKSSDLNLPHRLIYGVESASEFFKVAVIHKDAIPQIISQGLYVIEDVELEFHSKDIPDNDASRIGEITGSSAVSEQYGINGTGISIAVVDTGVDFSNPDIQQSLARDFKNHPIMLDADGQGLVLTNATFIANIDKNGIIRTYGKKLPPDITSNVYVTKEGVFLNISQNGKGTEIPIYNSFFPQAGSSIVFNGTLSNDMKIGDDNRNYIKSKSGIYRLGIMYQGGLSGPYARVQVVPVLVVDANEASIYDTIIPDLSTSWKDYTRFDLNAGQSPDYDFDFTDEKPIILGSGKEFLVYDSNGDGRPDYSAGTIGAQVLDIHNVIENKTAVIDDTLQAINGTLLPGLDPDGEFFGVMTDFMGHGTSSAATIASRGIEKYDIYNNTKQFSITGVAPGAKIIPVKALWFGDTVYAWLWAAGFDNDDTKWKFTGYPRADIISNSWGVSTFPSFQYAPGMDLLSVLQSLLVTPQSLDENYPGVTIVSSAGNSGHGYGTIGLPNASPFGISVGATTNNVFVGYGPFNEQPRFGSTTEHYNDVVDFSSRGPGIVGDPKPDLMSIGAHGFTPSNVLKTERDSDDESFSLFGGTSMAAPLVSGSAAILLEELQKQSKPFDPFTVKNILMSTATDLHNDPFVQGSGSVNVFDAIRFANEEDGVFIVTNNATYNNVKKILAPTIENLNATSLGFAKLEFPTKTMPTTNWFAGHLEAGQRSHAEFTIENPSDKPITVSISPQTFFMTHKTQINGTTVPHQQDPILNKTGTYAPNYIRLSDIKPHKDYGNFFENQRAIPDDTSLLVLNLNFDFDSFMNSTAKVYADDLKISSLYLYDWIDSNNDTSVSSDELSLINRGGSWGTVQEIRITQPNEKFKGTPLVGVYPVPTRYSYWIGDTKMNSTAFDYTLSASYYKKQDWSAIWTEPSEVTVPPNSDSKILATLIAPNDLQTGIYQGFLTFQGKNHTVNAPVSFAIKEPVKRVDSTVIINGKESDDVMYGSGYIRGAFDMTNRYMAGDWRQYYFDIQDSKINSAAIEMSWNSDNTNLAVFVMDPRGKIVQTNMPSGVFGHFLGWPSLDWLGISAFSQGGGFYPVKNKDNTSTVLYVPINQTGTYSLLAHSTLFGGNSTTEPLSVIARFLNISDELPKQAKLIDEKQLNFTKTMPKNQTEKDTLQTPQATQTTVLDSTDDGDLLLGIGIGIGIGTAIGVGAFFVLRPRSSK